MRMLEPGDVVADKYQVKQLIGRGGMGEVYLVRHALTGRRFALKVLAPKLVGRAAASQRLVREALAAGRVEHRNVVEVFDVGEHRGAVYLVMEYLEGRPLSELLEQGTLSDKRILALVLRAMEGVAAAHAHGIVHRDLKPENIFVCIAPDGSLDEPRVMDFGISRLPDQLGSDTHSGFVVGTPHFMCLEQLEGARDLDARVDVYALGVSLYRAFSGRVPFEGENLAVLSHRIAHDTPVPLSLHRPDLPHLLCQTIMKAMARRREDRHPSVRALARDLEPFVDGLSDMPRRERRRMASFNTGSLPHVSSVLTPPPITATTNPHPALSASPTGSQTRLPSAPQVAASPYRAVPADAVPPAPSAAPRPRQSLRPWLYMVLAVPAAALVAYHVARAAMELRSATPRVAAASAPAPSVKPPSSPPAAALTPAMIATPPSAPDAAKPETKPAMRAARPALRTSSSGRPKVALPATQPVPDPGTATGTRTVTAPEPGDDLLREIARKRTPRRMLDETDPYAE